MTLNELNKNSKFGYRRKEWDPGSDSYIAFVNGKWAYEWGRDKTGDLILENLKATDWYLTTIPNKFYKRVAIVTKDVNGHPVGSRIVLGKNHSWVLEGGTSDEEYRHEIGSSCEWEDEMESPFPCFKKNKAHKHIVMFTSYKLGSVVKEGNLYLGEEEESSSWVSYDDTSIWEPCEDPRQKRKFKVGDRIRYKRSSIHTIAFIEDDRYRLEGNSYILFTDGDLWELVSTAIQPSPKPEEPEIVETLFGYDSCIPSYTFKDDLNCSSEPIPTQQKQKENKMDLRLLLAMMTAMSAEETPKDATNSKHVVIVTKDDAYEGYFYADDLDAIKDIVAEPKNELKKFHVFDYQTTLGQKPRKVVEVKR